MLVRMEVHGQGKLCIVKKEKKAEAEMKNQTKNDEMM